MLNPILVTGLGRSGTTAIMSLLGTDPAVAFDRIYAFEKRHLTNLVKLFLIVNRVDFPLEFEPVRMRFLEQEPLPTVRPLSLLPDPASMALFAPLWDVAAHKVTSPTSIYYAEKAPDWLGPFVSPYLNPFTIRLFRDPRDNFISSLAFMRKRGSMIGFGRNEGDSDETFARTLCAFWISSYEAWTMTRTDPRAIMHRYEDFAKSPEALASDLNQRLNLHLDPSAIEDLPGHRSAPTHTGSIARYEAEPLAPALIDIFTECLGEEMAALNYCPPPPPRKFPRLHFKDLFITAFHDGTMTPTQDRAQVQIDGPDFYFALPIEPFNAADVHSLWLSAKAPIGDHCTIYWRRAGEAFSEERAVHHRYFPGHQWRVIDFDFASHPLWAGAIAELRIDLFNFTGQFVPGLCEVTWLRLIAQRDGFSKC